MVLVALALIGGTPNAISAGKVRSVPPPAMEFMAPATSAASTTSVSCVKGSVADGWVPVDSRGAPHLRARNSTENVAWRPHRRRRPEAPRRPAQQEEEGDHRADSSTSRTVVRERHI